MGRERIDREVYFTAAKAHHFKYYSLGHEEIDEGMDSSTWQFVCSLEKGDINKRRCLFSSQFYKDHVMSVAFCNSSMLIERARAKYSKILTKFNHKKTKCHSEKGKLYSGKYYCIGYTCTQVFTVILKGLPGRFQIF